MPDYNYDEFSAADYDLKGKAGPAIGQPAPDFTLETADGETRRLLDFEGELLVLELGSVTCPLFHSRRKGMLRLDQEFPKISFAILYVREAHPGANIPAHQSYEDKKACASRLSTEDKDSRTIFVDGLDGAAHKAYGALPNAVFIIDKEGTVRFKAEWNNPVATREALKALVDGKQAEVRSYFQPAKPWVVHRTVKRAGKGAGTDFLRGLPHLVWNMAIMRNVKTLLSERAESK